MSARSGWAVLLAGLAACNDRHYTSEEFSDRYPQRAEVTRQERTERREILHWGSNPKDKKRIGFLWKMETQVAGSRATRDSYYIVNPTGTVRLGFVTAEGKFYRLTGRDRAVGANDFGDYVGEYPMTLGLKVFFGFPLSDNLELDEIDPYK